MPKGIPNKKESAPSEVKAAIEPVKVKETTDEFQERFLEAQIKRDAEIKLNKPEAAVSLPALHSSQQYFESPEGFIEVGESGKLTIWCQRANKGKGAFINPKR